MKKIKELRSVASTKILAIIVGVLFIAAIIPSAIVFANYSFAAAGKDAAKVDQQAVVAEADKEAQVEEAIDGSLPAKDSEIKDSGTSSEVVPVSNEVVHGRILDAGSNPIPLSANPYALVIGIGEFGGYQHVVYADADGYYTDDEVPELFAGLVYAGAEGHVNNIHAVSTITSLEANFWLKTGKTCHFGADYNPGLYTTVVQAGSYIHYSEDVDVPFLFDVDLGYILENNLPIGFPDDVTLTLGKWNQANVLNYYYYREGTGQMIDLNIEVRPMWNYHFYGWLLNENWAWGPKSVNDIPGPGFSLVPVFETDYVKVSGRVMDEHFMPVSGAKVTFASSDENFTKETKTNWFGYYEMYVPRTCEEGNLTFSKDDVFEAQAKYNRPFPLVNDVYINKVLRNGVDVVVDGGQGHDKFICEYYVDGELKDSTEVSQISEKLYLTTVVTYQEDGTITAEVEGADGAKYLTKVTIVPNEGCQVASITLNGEEFNAGDQFVITEDKDIQGLVVYETVGPHPGPIPPAPPTPDPDNPITPVVNPGAAQTGDMFNLAAIYALLVMVTIVVCVCIPYRKFIEKH